MQKNILKSVTEQQYANTHRDFKGVYSSDNIHGTNHNGKRTLLTSVNGATVLLIEGESLEITKN